MYQNVTHAARRGNSKLSSSALRRARAQVIYAALKFLFENYRLQEFHLEPDTLLRLAQLSEMTIAQCEQAIEDLADEGAFNFTLDGFCAAITLREPAREVAA